MGNKGSYETMIDGVVELHKIKVAVDKPSHLSNMPSEKDIAMSKLGVDKKRLFGEAVRYVMAHGDNFNFIEADLPVSDIEMNAVASVGYDTYEDVPVQSRAKLDKIIDKAINVAAESVIRDASILANMQSIKDARQNLENKFGPGLEIEFKSMDEIQGTDSVIVTLQAERSIPQRVVLPDKG